MLKTRVLTLLTAGALILGVFCSMGAQVAQAEQPPSPSTGYFSAQPLSVDGVLYWPTLVVGDGPTFHYEAPTPLNGSQSYVFTQRHRWEGHGQENLEGGCLVGHWIDNKNVLTLSHCVEYPPTTTTTVPATTTTSTVPATTTSTTLAVVTTTVPEASTTTLAPTTTTSEAPTTTAATPTTTLPGDPELPKTGPPAVLLPLGLLGLGLIVLGIALLKYRSKRLVP